ncbi:hypothetical protein ACTXK0_07085 [Corynebacterium variabile]|uniref:hypothetical protein n=2 Tax=Corynebacterium variabile TaxID=1727 RepID=UPI003F8EF498
METGMTTGAGQDTTEKVKPDPQARSRADWIKAAAVGAGMALVGCIMAIAFLWPLTNATPKNVELGLAGPEQAVAAMETNLDTQNPDLFDITTYDTREEAVTAVEEREIAGAIVTGGDRTEFLVASAGAAQVSQLLTQMADGMSVQQGSAVTVTDVVAGGRNAGAISMAIIAALIPGLAGSMVGFMAVKRAVNRFATLTAAGVVSGILSGLILGPWFGVLAGDYWAGALAIGLGTMAIGGFITGLGALLGGKGLGIGALTIMLFANPWSGNMAPKEFLPEPWGTIGSYMPNGTLITLLRDLSYFPSAPTAGLWWTLIAWVAFGLVCLCAGSWVQEKKAAEVAGADQ